MDSVQHGHNDSGNVWSRIPVWDGKATTWRSFEKDLQWFLAGEDLTKVSYNLAARIVQRQSGAVKRRAREFDPAEIGPRAPTYYTEDEAASINEEAEAGDFVTAGGAKTPLDHMTGISIVLEAWKTMVGLDKAETQADLRDTFYKHLGRRRGERVADFASRFREHVALRKGEGIELDDAQTMYMLKEKMAITPYRREMLETFLGTWSTYGQTEAALIRLFGKIHENEGYAAGKDDKKRDREAHETFAEKFEEDTKGAEDDRKEDQVEDDTVWTEIRDTIAEAEAAAEELGDDDDVQLFGEATEKLAEAYVTMREAKEKLAFTRKDRQFNAPKGAGRGKRAGEQKGKGKGRIEERKTKSRCWVCGQQGHWAGDPGCPGRGAKGGRDHEAACVDWETMMVEVDKAGPRKSESAALEAPGSSKSQERYIERVVYSAEGMGIGFGALDSACNRTVVGAFWLQSFLIQLQALALAHLVGWCSEVEFFRFGNGGRLKSDRRYSLPVTISGSPAFIQVSVVASPTLGALLGKDLQKALGLVIDFASDNLSSKVLGLDQVDLKELAAGHFYLPLLPVDVEVWKHVSLDAVSWRGPGKVLGLISEGWDTISTLIEVSE